MVPRGRLWRTGKQTGGVVAVASALVRSRAGVFPWREALIAALPAWLLGHALVVAVGAIAASRYGVSPLHVWDADWYYKLGVDGYGAHGAEGSRFFPLLPVIVGAGAWLGLPAKAWLVGVCWVAALFFGAAVYRLTVLETGDEAAGRRAAWLTQLVPGAGVLAIGYTEGLAGLLAALYFVALRHSSDTRAGLVFGALSGLVRPTGPVLALPGAVEALRTGRWRSVTARGLALAAAPLVGTGAYLVWNWAAFGDPLTPYRVQSADDLRGGLVQPPWEFLARDTPGGYPWELVLALLAVAGVALLLCLRLLPLTYLAWSVPMVGLAVTAWGLHSLPRYLAAVFPLWMAVALACRRRWLWLIVLAVSVAGFAWVAYLTVAPGGPVP